jgi:2-desacetyl-2-hydroxyethyl bacteriochlorophyllide A dehydrogenase
MTHMLAARYLGPHQLEPKEVLLPEISDGEALIEVEACGFCGSDLNIVAGIHPRAKAPLTLGHEVSGRILDIRSTSRELTPGDRVTAYPLLSCGRCHACTHGNPHVCRELRLFGFDVDGCMAQYVRLPVESLIKLPEAMPPHIGALIEPLAVAVHGIARASLQDVRLAAVLGAGPIGLLTALVAQASGIEHVVISDVRSSRLRLAQELGLEAVHAEEELYTHLMDRSDKNGADIVYECAGHPSSAREMTTLLRPRGTIVNLSVFKEPVAIDMQAVNFKELEIVGSRVYERKDFQMAVDMAMHLPLERIVTHSFPLLEVTAAFERFSTGEACKVVILPGAAQR